MRSMNCSRCNSPRTYVVDSRPTDYGVRRRRRCETCGKRFTTYEIRRPSAGREGRKPHDGHPRTGPERLAARARWPPKPNERGERDRRIFGEPEPAPDAEGERVRGPVDDDDREAA